MAFTIDCPVCGHKCEADFIDNGVGDQRISLFFCDNCHWQEKPNENCDIQIAESDSQN